MPLNSVNTNLGAMVALQSLNRANDEMAAVQKRVSTGLRVSDAKDDGAAFAIAQSVRTDVAGLTSANQQLGNAKGVVDTTLAGLKGVSDMMGKAKEVLVKLADTNVTGDARKQYEAQYAEVVKSMTNFLQDATYNGKSLLGTGAVGSATAATDVKVVRNENANGDITVVAQQYDDATNPLLLAATAPTGADDAAKAAAAKAMLDGTATPANAKFTAVFNNINTAMNKFGNSSNLIESQITYNKTKIDSLEGGLGAMIDADLAKESAKLQALQIRQQLGTQSLGIANQAPQSLLSLFR